MIPGEEIPSALKVAYELLHDDRAWVACIARGPGVVSIVGSATKRSDLAQHPATAPYLHPDCPKQTRAAFLMGGVRKLEDEVLA